MNNEEDLTPQEESELREIASHVPESLHGIARAIEDLLMKFRCAPYTEEDVASAIETLEAEVENCMPMHSLMILLGSKK